MSAWVCGCDPDWKGHDNQGEGWHCSAWPQCIRGDHILREKEARMAVIGGGLLQDTKTGNIGVVPGSAKPLGPVVRQFDSGATRNTDTAKFDFEGFLNPEALHAFGEYMHEHRLQRDGTVRDSDNWQKGIPLKVYIKSLVRHTIDLWRMDRGYAVTNPDTGRPHTKKALCAAITFNAMGYLKELVDPSPINGGK